MPKELSRKATRVTRATTRAAIASRFKVMRFMELISKTSGGGGENEVENPKASVFVAFDSLVVAKDSHTIGKCVVVNVNETGA